jgi:hypothetical protein
MKMARARRVLAGREPLGVSLLENKLSFYLHASSMPQTRSMAKASFYAVLSGSGQEWVGLCPRLTIYFAAK